MADPDLDVRRDLIGWSEPLIVDCVNHYYFTTLPDHPQIASELATRHYRVWRRLLRGAEDEATTLRAELVECAGGAAPDGECVLVDGADRAIFNELMDVVVTRFQRSPYKARAYGLSLLDTASGLARARLAA